MIPWELAAVTLALGVLVGLGLRLVVDYAELEAYRRVARRAGSTLHPSEESP